MKLRKITDAKFNMETPLMPTTTSTEGAQASLTSKDALNYALILTQGVDLRRTENFLLSLDDVTNASVWLDSGKLCAHVSMLKDANWTESALKRSCYESIGFTQTPHSILLLKQDYQSAELSLAG